MTEIQRREQAIIDEFELFDDWMGRYEHLIDQAAKLPAIDEAFKTDAYKIRGCQSQVWLHAGRQNGQVVYTADSDAAITKGLIALLIRVLSNLPPGEIVTADLRFLDAIEMKEHLSPTRKNGLNAMIKQMKLYAAALSGADHPHTA
ncbi:MAG: SufE family protein [Rhodothermales bacterium]|nr:SufE family protein [Rhodothermales bacterium]